MAQCISIACYRCQHGKSVQKYSLNLALLYGLRIQYCTALLGKQVQIIKSDGNNCTIERAAFKCVHHWKNKASYR